MRNIFIGKGTLGKVFLRLESSSNLKVKTFPRLFLFNAKQREKLYLLALELYPDKYDRF